MLPNCCMFFKLRGGLGHWTTFVAGVKEKFGAYDHRKSIEDLIALGQEGSVEDYTREFQIVQFQVSMFNSDFDDMFFTSQLCQ
jgi:hypothetical protein